MAYNAKGQSIYQLLLRLMLKKFDLSPPLRVSRQSRFSIEVVIDIDEVQASRAEVLAYPP